MNTHIIVAFSDGSIFLKSVTDDAPPATLLYREAYNPIRDMVLVSFNVVFAMESGDVRTIALNLDQPALLNAV